MDKEDGYVILITELLTDIKKGIYTKTIYYSNGDIETELVPKGPIIIEKLFSVW